MSPDTHLAPTSRLDRFAATIVHFVPDAITASVILLIVLAFAAFAFGHEPRQVMDAYYRGLWMLLPFTMQMTLIIVLSSSLASTPFFRRVIVSLSRLPRNTNQMVALAALLTAAASYGYWGLGIALGPVIAVYFAKEAERRGIGLDFPFLLSIVSVSVAVWQYGLSATAPLLIATPGHFLEGTIGVVPLTRTIWSPAALIQVTAFMAGVILLGCRLMPVRRRPLSQYPESERVAEPPSIAAPSRDSYSEVVERKPYFAAILCAVLFAWLWYHFMVRGASLDINSLNTTLLLLCFALHSNVKSFAVALERAVVSSWPVVVLYHLYAGLAGLIQYTSVGDHIAGMAASVTTPLTFPALTAAISTLFAFFIPSSGGQWAIQGFVTVKSAMAVGVTPERGLLAMGIGDHMGNLTSPFWYLITAGIVRLDFRAFFGYGLVFAAWWFVLGVVVFTFAPC